MRNVLDVSIILPTRNEAENIASMITQVSDVLRTNGLSGEIIVIDDDSSDGTAAIAENMSNGCPVQVFVRKGVRGLATAVMKGFELAEGQICVVMDADFSHPLVAIPGMISPILEEKCDMTVGSRYVSGGGCHDWPLIRRIVSRGSGLLARGVTRLSDPTSGFMAIRRELVTHADLDPVGWKIVLETAVKVRPRIMEIPIVFTDREQGKSKLDMKVQVDYLRHLGRLYLHAYRGLARFIQFCIVGLSGIAVDTLVLMSMVELLKLDPRSGAIAAFLFAVTWNYGFNRVWTFREFGRRRYSYLSFVLISAIGLIIRLGVMHLLLEYAGMKAGRFYVVANFVGILFASVFNFIASRYISFSGQSNKT